MVTLSAGSKVIPGFQTPLYLGEMRSRAHRRSADEALASFLAPPRGGRRMTPCPADLLPAAALVAKEEKAPRATPRETRDSNAGYESIPHGDIALFRRFRRGYGKIGKPALLRLCAHSKPA
jgi:hypothetical protein